MPSNGLSDDEIADVIAYIRDLVDDAMIRPVRPTPPDELAQVEVVLGRGARLVRV